MVHVAARLGVLDAVEAHGRVVGAPALSGLGLLWVWFVQRLNVSCVGLGVPYRHELVGCGSPVYPACMPQSDYVGSGEASPAQSPKILGLDD